MMAGSLRRTEEALLKGSYESISDLEKSVWIIRFINHINFDLTPKRVEISDKSTHVSGKSSLE